MNKNKNIKKLEKIMKNNIKKNMTDEQKPKK